MPASTPATGSRQITIQADFIGTAGTGTGATGGRVTLTDARTGAVTTLTRANGGIVSWTPGTASTPDTIVDPGAGDQRHDVPAGPEAAHDRHGATPTAACPASTASPCTCSGERHRRERVTYNPTGRQRAGAAAGTATDPHASRTRSTRAAAGSLLVLSPGIYNENVLVWKPLKIQGLGPGGIIGAHELQAPRPGGPAVPRQGLGHRRPLLPAERHGLRRHRGGARAVRRRRRRHADGPARRRHHRRRQDHDGVRPAGTGRDGRAFSAARIDGLGLMTGHGDGAGGIQLQANVNNMQLTNNVLENNGGVVAGGIGDRPAVRARQPQLQRADRQRPAASATAA